MAPKVSLFASAIRPALWAEFMESLQSNECDYEVVFSGPCTLEQVQPFIEKYKNFKYIHTKNIKPCQNYEIARRNCTGELVLWTADDAECSPKLLDKIYDYWKSKNNKKLILSIQTKESGYGTPGANLFNMQDHRLVPGDMNSPLMAPLGVMNREYLQELGGIDRRYLCGQYENSIVMKALSDGASVEVFGDSDNCIILDHLEKSIRIGESTNEKDFLNRPFATGYVHDRSILLRSWLIFDDRRSAEIAPWRITAGKYKISKNQNDSFEPFEDENLLEKSQSYRGQWE